MTTCQHVGTIGLPCEDGSHRDLLPIAGVLTATITDTAIAGGALERDDVVVSGTTQPVSALVGRSTFTMTRQ